MSPCPTGCDVDDFAVDPGNQLAKEEGSDSDDEPNLTGVVKSVTFADAIDLTVEEANADDAATSGVQVLILPQLQQQL
jgi:hypothetical protein